MGRFLDWMVERAVPPFIDDRAQQRIAEEAAENGIRQTARVAVLAGGILFAAIAGIFYMYLPSRHITPMPSEATRAAPQPGAEHEAKRRQSAEDLHEQLDEVTKERDTLQGRVTALEGQVVAVKSELQAAKVLDASKGRPPAEELQKKLDEVTKERDRLQGQVTSLERQVAEGNKKLQATQALAAPKVAPRVTKKATSTARPPILASRPSTYRCGDGRTVRIPTACRPANASTPGVFPSPPSTYRCGDGRTVRNPAECQPAPRG